MIRTTFLAFTLAIALAANAPANEPTVDLETAILEIMTTAFCVGDYDTVETLFDKLSSDGKKKFVQEGSAFAAGKRIGGNGIDCTLVDGMFQRVNQQYASMDVTLDKFMSFLYKEYLPQKMEQTQLLGRLTLSLFEQSAHQIVKPMRLLTQGNAIEIVCVDGNIILLSEDSHDPPIVSVNLPHLENREQINGKYTIGPDGFLTFGYGGRVYIEGLTIDECRNAIEFHFAKYNVLPQPQPHSPYQVPQAASEKQAVR